MTVQGYDIKRFAECVKYDPAFAGRFSRNGAAVLEEYRINGDPQTLARMLASQKDLSNPDETLIEDNPAFSDYCAFASNLREASQGSRHVTMLSGNAFGDWHSRQKIRFENQAPEGLAAENSHIYFAVELSKGCSVGCPYCAGASGKLQGYYEFTEENCSLMLGMIRSIHRLADCSSPRGLLYCYTEPFDNPDYERFLQRYYESFGAIPQTTAADWMNHVERTRKLLRWCLDHRAGIQRLSINSLDDFRLCMRSFGSEEFKNVLLACRYPEADGVIYRAGRARKKDNAVDGTSCCVTGFLINMVDRSIKLVTPCIEPDKWPCGYRIIASGKFETEADFGAFLDWCTEHVFNKAFDGETKPLLRGDFSVKQGSGEVCLLSRYKKFTFRKPLEKELVLRLDGKKTLDDITRQFDENAGEAYTFLQLLWDEGLLAEPEGLTAER
ncbi:MAG: hypothetical protein AB7T27_06990 [Kiritimatiellia bacterium]